MPKIPISSQTLNALGDGYAGKAIDAALDVLNRDLIDRGADGKARKLTVTYEFKPLASARRCRTPRPRRHRARPRSSRRWRSGRG